MSQLLLAPNDLAGLTGRTQAAAQLRWLMSRNWHFEVGGDGLPKVARAYFERRMA